MFQKDDSSSSFVGRTHHPHSSSNDHNHQTKKGHKNNKNNSKQDATESTKKLAKDVTLRKSDRRQLYERMIQTVLAFQDERLDNNKDLQDSQDTTLSMKQCIVQLFKDIALANDGTMIRRTLELTTPPKEVSDTQKVVLYVRSPSSIATPVDSSPSSTVLTTKNHRHTDTEEEEEDTANEEEPCLIQWPYQQQPQCVWIQGLSHGEVVWELPSLALMSVLPPQWYLLPPPATTTNPSTSTTLLPSMSNSLTQCPPTYVCWVPRAVSKYLCRGAHLMRAGIIQVQALGESTSHTHDNNDNNNNIMKKKKHPNSLYPIALVVVMGNPQAMAVGILHPDMLTNATNEQEPKGVGVTIVSCYGDDIWKKQLPPKTQRNGQMIGIENPYLSTMVEDKNVIKAVYDAGQYGNPGFLEGTHVVPIVTKVSNKVEEDDERSEDECSTTNEEQGNAESTVNHAEDAPPPAIVSDAEVDAAVDTVEENDKILHAAVCTALCRLTKQDLPMTMATFYAKYVLENRPPNTTIVLKQTRYKKFSKYVQEHTDLLQTGPDPSAKKTKDPLAMLVGFDKKHEDLRPYMLAAKAEAASQGGSLRSDAKRKLVLVDLYCIPHHFQSLLRLDPDVVRASNASSEGRKNSGMLTLKEVRAVLDDYITRESLTIDGTSNVQLDGPLTDALYRQKKNKNATTNIPMALSRKDLADLWKSKMETAFALVEMPGNRILRLGRGVPPLITIEVQKRQSKKFVTYVRGLEDYDIEAPAFGKDVSYRFACSHSVEDDPKDRAALRKGRVELVFQGNLADELEALLLGDETVTSHGGAKDSDYRLPKNSIEFVLRKGVPARKRRNPPPKKKEVR